MNNWLYLGIIPILAAIISAGYFKEDVVTFITQEPNYFGLTNQFDDPKRTLKLFEEDWRLTRVGTSIYSVVKPRDMPESSWEYRGFERGQFMSLSYQTRNSTSEGIGVLFLLRNGNSSEWQGYITAKDCTVQEVVRCPYVLVPISETVSAREKYKDFLAQECVVQSFKAEIKCNKQSSTKLKTK